MIQPRRLAAILAAYARAVNRSTAARLCPALLLVGCGE